MISQSINWKLSRAWPRHRASITRQQQTLFYSRKPADKLYSPPKSCEMGTAGLSPAVKRPRREHDHWPHNVDCKNSGSCAATDPCIFMAGCIIKPWVSFTTVKIRMKNVNWEVIWKWILENRNMDRAQYWYGIWYDMVYYIWYDIWYDTVWYMIWYMIIYDTILYDMMWYITMMLYDCDIKWSDMIYDTIFYDMIYDTIFYDIWYMMWYDCDDVKWYDIWYDILWYMIYDVIWLWWYEVIWYMIRYFVMMYYIWYNYDMIYDTILYDMWYDCDMIWWYDIWYDILWYDIYVLPLVFHPVVVVGGLVQKKERDSTKGKTKRKIIQKQ